MRSDDIIPSAAEVLSHGEAAITGLVELITMAVRSSEDDQVARLDRILRDVERMTASARRF